MSESKQGTENKKLDGRETKGGEKTETKGEVKVADTKSAEAKRDAAEPPVKRPRDEKIRAAAQQEREKRRLEAQAEANRAKAHERLREVRKKISAFDALPPVKSSDEQRARSLELAALKQSESNIVVLYGDPDVKQPTGVVTAKSAKVGSA